MVCIKLPEHISIKDRNPSFRVYYSFTMIRLQNNKKRETTPLTFTSKGLFLLA